MDAARFGRLFGAARDLARTHFVEDLSARDYAAHVCEALRRSEPIFAKADPVAMTRVLVRAIRAPKLPAPALVLEELHAITR